MGSINKVENVVGLNPENVIKNCMLFVMRKHYIYVGRYQKNRYGGVFL